MGEAASSSRGFVEVMLPGYSSRYSEPLSDAANSRCPVQNQVAAEGTSATRPPRPFGVDDVDRIAKGLEEIREFSGRRAGVPSAKLRNVIILEDDAAAAAGVAATDEAPCRN